MEEGIDLSIVLPVYNEGEAVAPVIRALVQGVHSRCEILVVYDFDGDTTVPVARALAAELPEVRPLRNDLGRGVLDAFLVGGAMFLGTFLIGNNYMYRLLLILLTMPQLLQWMRNPGTRRAATPILLVVLALLWLSAATRDAGLGNNGFQALSVALFVVLGGLLVEILWIQTSVMRRQLLQIGARAYRGSGAGAAGT